MNSSVIKALALSIVFLFLVACGGGGKGSGGGRSTGPTEEQRAKLIEAQSNAEAAESAYFEAKKERIELERLLEDQE
jgi:hypothetical protein